jgi:hypothetical protein
LRGFQKKAITGIFPAAAVRSARKESAHQIMSNLHRLPLVAFLTLGGFPSLHAATTSNLTFPDGSWPGDTVTSTVYLASSFTTNSASTSYRLDSVTVNMGTAITADGGFILQIRSNSSSRPGSLVAQLTGEVNPASGLYTYTPTTTITLNASTTYWVVAGVAGGTGEFRWLAAANNNQTGDWTIGNNIGFGTNSGTTWSMQGFPPSLFSVSATVVPEPGAFILALAGGIGTIVSRRRASHV